ncbi:MAG: hypothetical protein BWY98_01258 [Tenericutes bacterium ADurb.BinA155]|nr:MAG: hypothetical protein BWY98_01258 [Tenericutes bacterium ADurb.BinA155]
MWPLAEAVLATSSHDGFGPGAFLLVRISQTSPVLSTVESGTITPFTIAPTAESPTLVWIL